MFKKFIFLTSIFLTGFASGMEPVDSVYINNSQCSPIHDLPKEILDTIESFLSCPDKARFFRVIYGDKVIREKYKNLREPIEFEKFIEMLRDFLKESKEDKLGYEIINLLEPCRLCCNDKADLKQNTSKIDELLEQAENEGFAVAAHIGNKALHMAFDIVRSIDPTEKNLWMINYMKKLGAQLIRKGACLSIKNKSDETVLISAIETEYFPSVELILQQPDGLKLINYQPKLNDPHAEWLSGLMIAAEKGSISMVRAIIAAGADPMLTNSSGETASQIALNNQHDRVTQMLSDYEKQWAAEQAEQPAQKKQRLSK